MKKIFILSMFALLAGCVEESYRTEHYSTGSSDRYYDNMTSGYNRDYQKRDTGYHSGSSNANKDSGYISRESTVKDNSGYQSNPSTDNRSAHSSNTSEYVSSASSNQQQEADVDNGYS